jgi:hypothetical protein
MAPRLVPYRGSKAFPSLSVKDLLEAREAYHVHLTRLPNVVATAIGRYRRSKRDPAKDSLSPKEWSTKDDQPPKTLSNSEVTACSWPCILVFVKRWFTRRELLESTNKDALVPNRLYLPDGRIVPTCVVCVEPDESAAGPIENLAFPAGLIGGGYPLLTDVQGAEHVASVGCLVTDGDLLYSLTNRHVTGAPGREISASVGGNVVRIGIADERQIGKILFRDAYNKWPGEFVYANLDVGLIRLDDLRYWTAQVYGVGTLGPLVDLHADSVTLDLVGCRVKAFGAVSGELDGEIQGLFYRYKSLGGFDYVTDVLIGPTDEEHPLRTRPGDSGTIWSCEVEEDEPAGRKKSRPVYHPLAVQWGGHRFLEGVTGGRYQFALGSFLSTICRELDVAFVPDLNIGHSEYWGKLGHFKIAAKACELVSNAKLKKLLMANQDRIAYGDDVLHGELPSFTKKDFVPLADVPDLVWRSTRGKDKANHFADMDQAGKGKFAGKTLLDLCKKASNVSARVWAEFYDGIGTTKDKDRGALPFRVWQMFDEMVEFLKQGKVAEFLCAGGTMAHYAGDACQPLHISQFHDGRTPAEAGVHAAYETQMVDRNRVELVDGVNKAVGAWKASPQVKSGKEAAGAIVGLMRDTFKAVPPDTIIDAYNAAGQKPKAMWPALKQDTIAAFVRGTQNLAMLWESAWRQGGGDKIAPNKLGPIATDKLMSLYNDRNFVKSFWLDEMVAAGIGLP